MVQYGSMVDAFFLDTRNGYLGRSQTEWLSEKLLNSVAKWKLLFYGLPLCSTSHDVPVRDGNAAIHIRTTFDDEDTGRGEARVSIQVEDEEETHADKYSLISVLSALTTIFASNEAEEEHNMRTAAPEAPAASSVESGLTRIKTGIVVISGGRSRYSSVPSGPYVISFTPNSKVHEATDAWDSNHYYAEIYAGGEDMSLDIQPPLFSSEIIHDSLWCSENSSDFSFVKLFLDGNSMLRVEIWSVSDDGLSLTDREILHGTSGTLAPRLLFAGALDALTPLSD